jgi:hypothetical protein
MEIVGLQMKIAKFILFEVLSKDGSYSIAQAQTYKD